MKNLDLNELNINKLASFTNQSNEFYRPTVISKKSSIKIVDSSPLTIEEKQFLSNLDAPEGNPKNFKSSLFLFNK